MDTEKKLYRSNENKILFGVCSGFSKYSGMDVSIVRIVFFLIAITSGIPIILYLVLGLILPLEEIEAKREYKIDEDEYSYNEDDYKF